MSIAKKNKQDFLFGEIMFLALIFLVFIPALLIDLLIGQNQIKIEKGMFQFLSILRLALSSILLILIPFIICFFQKNKEKFKTLSIVFLSIFLCICLLFFICGSSIERERVFLVSITFFIFSLILLVYFIVNHFFIPKNNLNHVDGLYGWLLFYIILITAALLISSFNIFEIVASNRRYSYQAFSSLAYYSFIILAVIISLILVLKRNKYFAKIQITLLYSIMFLSVIRETLELVFFHTKNSERYFVLLILGIMLGVAWILYFKNSNRISYTFRSKKTIDS